MMAIDACHVIYEIRITRQYFKEIQSQGRQRIGWKEFSLLLLCLHVVSLHAPTLVPL